MTNYTSIHVSPLQRAGPPHCHMSGVDHDIPVVEFLDGDHSVTVSLANHDDPARWLRGTAGALVLLAERVEAAQVEAEPESPQLGVVPSS